MSIYLDYNASAPIDKRVLDIMINVYKNNIGNADSRTHDYGDQARALVENARGQVARLLNVANNEVFFTSGATESNNIAIQGLIDYGEETGKKHIITSAIEHKAVLETVKYMEKRGFDISIVSPRHDGRVDTEDIIKTVSDRTLLVSLMHVNNETGIIQPVSEIGKYLKTKGVLFHVDATQSCGKLVDELKTLDYDLLSFSAHKMRGPQGVGCLVMKRKNYKLPPIKPIMFGGQQESGIRPGTVPVALIAGCGEACEIALKEHRDNEAHALLIKKELCDLLEHSGLEYVFNGDQNFCMSSVANIHLKGISSEALMLSTKGYCSISNGSACTSNSYSPSYVLKAMGIPDEDIMESLRISWGSETKIDDFKENMAALLEIAKSFV